MKDPTGLAIPLLQFSEIILVKSEKGNFKKGRLGDHGRQVPDSIQHLL